MSASRIMRRREWVSKCPPNRRAEHTVDTGSGIPHFEFTRTSYHSWLLTSGYRYERFQQSKRAARVALGLAPTSTDMHRVFGKAI